MVSIFEDARLVDAGVDWITATAKEVDICEALVNIGQQTTSELEGSGYFIKKGGFQGYTGYGATGCFYGTRKDGACLRLSGATAHRQACRVAELPVNITRLDLQVTVQFADDRRSYAHEFMVDYRNQPGGTLRGPKRRTQLLDAHHDGSTASIGTRTAAFYGRIYDKGREDPRAYPTGTWRAESECKRSAATPTFAALAAHSFCQDAVIAMLRSQFAARGVRVMVESPMTLDAPVVPRATTDVQRRLDWLERVARPVLIAVHDAGHGAAAAKALYGWMMPEATEDDGT